MAHPPEGERGTGDLLPEATLAADVSRVLDVLVPGGVAILALDVAYAIVATSEGGIRRIFSAKNRSYEKPSGMFGNWMLSGEVHVMDADRHAMVRSVIEEDNLPFSVVAPFRDDHPVFADVAPFVLNNSSKAGTLDMLLNAGQVHNEIARQSVARGTPVFGSSANTSLAGTKYRFGDIEAKVRDAADIHLDYGRSKYANPQGRASTIIDFQDFRVIRIGVRFDVLEDIFRNRFDVILTVDERTAK